jgi:flagellar basal-body rod modification protein FlgD
MSRISNINQAPSASSSSGTTGNDFSSVDLDQFLNLMITELQNQDPLSPTDNSQLLQQMTQIREIGATNELSKTLTSFATTQELTTASGLIGRRINALDDEANPVDGVVERVSVQVDEQDRNIRDVKVHIGSSIVDISNVREILQAE